MVKRIIGAGREILLEMGWDAASTNRIAERAGVSPGSLYQYFDNKEDLLASAVAQYMDEVEARVTDAFMKALPQAEPAVAVRLIVDGVLEAMIIDRGLLPVISRQAAGAAAERRERFRRRIDDLLVAALLSRTSGVSPQRVHTVAWMVVRAFERLVTAYIEEEPAITREQFVDEVSSLVIQFAKLN